MHLTPHTWKEARRLHAWHLKAQGCPQRRMAEAMGVRAAAVGQWMKRARNGGPTAWRQQPAPGAPHRLAPEQLARWPDLWHRGPRAYDVRGQVWTRTRVAEVIRVTCGVVDHPTPVGRPLTALRW